MREGHLDILETLIKDNSRDHLMIKEAPYQLSEVLHRFQQSKVKEKPVSLDDLKREINQLKSEIIQIKQSNKLMSQRITFLEAQPSKNNIPNKETSPEVTNPSTTSDSYLHLISQVTSQKW